MLGRGPTYGFSKPSGWIVGSVPDNDVVWKFLNVSQDEYWASPRFIKRPSEKRVHTFQTAFYPFKHSF